MNNIKINCIKCTIANIDKIIYNLNMSVRKIKKSYLSCTGYFASYKNHSQIAFESVLERDLCMLLEFDSDVMSYEEQPMQIYYPYQDKNRRYTPDILVSYKDGTKKLIEVKYTSEFSKKPELIEKFDILKSFFHKNYDLSFEIFTEKQINVQYLENLKFLYKFAFIPANAQYISIINGIIQQQDEISIKEILHKITINKQKQLSFLPYVWNYIFQNFQTIQSDFNKKLTMNTVVRKKG